MQIQDSQENVKQHLTGLKREVSTCEPGDTMKRLKKGKKKNTRNHDLNSVGVTKQRKAHGHCESLEKDEVPENEIHLQTLPSKRAILMPPVLPDRHIETPKTIMRHIRNA